MIQLSLIKALVLLGALGSVPFQWSVLSKLIFMLYLSCNWVRFHYCWLYRVWSDNCSTNWGRRAGFLLVELFKVPGRVVLVLLRFHLCFILKDGFFFLLKRKVNCGEQIVKLLHVFLDFLKAFSDAWWACNHFEMWRMIDQILYHFDLGIPCLISVEHRELLAWDYIRKRSNLRGYHITGKALVAPFSIAPKDGGWTRRSIVR